MCKRTKIEKIIVGIRILPTHTAPEKFLVDRTREVSVKKSVCIMRRHVGFASVGLPITINFDVDLELEISPVLTWLKQPGTAGAKRREENSDGLRKNQHYERPRCDASISSAPVR